MCRVLLMNHAAFPWLVLVPMRDGLSELYELDTQDYALAAEEIRCVAQAFQQFTRADKMNVAALGNMVPQLHIHVVARFALDAAWPNPVWNSGVSQKPYNSEKISDLINSLQLVIS